MPNTSFWEYDPAIDTDWIIDEHRMAYTDQLNLTSAGSDEVGSGLTKHLEEIRKLQDSGGVTENNETRKMWILTQSSVPVGCVSLRTWSLPGFDEKDPVQWSTDVTYLLVRADFRGKKLADELLKKADEVKDDEFEAAKKVYLRNGFKIDHTTETDLYGRECTLHRMIKE